MIKAVIFDLDGVIVSTDELHYLAWKYISDQEHIEFSKTINHRLRGVSRMASLEIILEKANKTYSNEEKEALAEKKNNYYIELLSSLTPKDILPNVLEVLGKLKDKGIKIAIGSSSKNAKAILKQIKLTDIFDEIADGNDIKKSKPAPDVFLIAAKKLGLNPKHCAVVEDAIVGIEAAKAAQMTAIAVFDAKKSELADYRFDDIRDILRLV
ncbi:MAG: beta-phosphoglucomutase [Tenericutes bacterium HGW-Tenericutes-2]|jgi:beta-phosphoglucomutase|nr:MAG: beta-phosphoglucomutase [Tenericutes bacterium HGW-Tenericutes-2]